MHDEHWELRLQRRLHLYLIIWFYHDKTKLSYNNPHIRSTMPRFFRNFPLYSLYLALKSNKHLHNRVFQVCFIADRGFMYIVVAGSFKPGLATLSQSFKSISLQPPILIFIPSFLYPA